MKKLLFTLTVLGHFFVSAQDKAIVETYNYGHDGMEYILQDQKGTTIVSTFHSKSDIKKEIALKVLDYYTRENKTTSDSIVIKGELADVTGKMIVKKSGLLTAVSFYYEKVEWKSGLTEIYKQRS